MIITGLQERGVNDLRYYKIVDGGYITQIGIGMGYLEISAEEYARIKEIAQNRPTPPEGYDYRLTESLEWELYELPPIDPADDEISDSEALAIILGGDV